VTECPYLALQIQEEHRGSHEGEINEDGFRKAAVLMRCGFAEHFQGGSSGVT